MKWLFTKPVSWQIVAAVIVVGLVICAFEISPALKQRAANAAAEEYAVHIQPQIAAEPRFKDVEVCRFSGFGCARVIGNVATAEDLASLHIIIEKSAPKNIVIQWKVNVADSAAPPTNGPATLSH